MKGPSPSPSSSLHTHTAVSLSVSTSWTSPDALALDLDHALARYKIPALQRLIYSCLVRGLVERGGAPESAFSALPAGAVPHSTSPLPVHRRAAGLLDLDFTDEDRWGAAWTPDFVPKGLVFDARAGDLLQLSAEGRVVRAWHGLKEIPQSMLAERHHSSSSSDGSGSENSSSWWGFSKLAALEKHPDMAVFLTYFDTPAALTLAQWIEWIDKEEEEVRNGSGAGAALKIKERSGGYAHLFRAHIPIFDWLFDNTAAWPTGRGGFFAALRADPTTYIHSRPDLLTWLISLRQERHVKVILATNSHATYARFVLIETLGASWRDAFDLVFFDCAKPAWFARPQPLGNAITDQPTIQTQTWGGTHVIIPSPPLPLPPHGTAPAILGTPPRESLRWSISVAASSTSSTPKDDAVLLPDEEYAGGSAALLDAALRAAALGRGVNGATYVTVYLNATGGIVRATAGGGEISEELPLDLSLATPPKVVFVGDHLHGDVAAAAAPPWCWHAVAVVEELTWDESAPHFFPTTTITTSITIDNDDRRAPNPLWSGFFGTNQNIQYQIDGNEREASHWSRVISTHAVAVVSDVTALNRFFI